MDENTCRSYILNMMKFAYEDGAMSDIELAHIENARKRFDIKKSDFNNLLKIASANDFPYQKIDSLIYGMQNFFDCVLVSICDSDLDDKELAAINKFGEYVGIGSGMIARIISDAYQIISTTTTTIVCTKCSTSSQAGVKFCPNCGNPLTKASQVDSISFAIPSTGIAIQFCESTSANFPQALSLSKANPTYQNICIAKKQWYQVAFGSINEALGLASLIGYLRNKRLYIDAQEKNWDDVFGFSYCVAQRQNAFKPIEYCFGKADNRLNVWGCKMSMLEWNEWANWFSYGRWEFTGIFKKTHSFIFDKDRIKHELATNLYRIRFCPHFRDDFVQAIVKHFPERVEMPNNPHWKYHTVYEEVPGSLKIIENHAYGETVTYTAGVRPVGFSVYIEMIEKALKECSIPNVKIQDIIG